MSYDIDEDDRAPLKPPMTDAELIDRIRIFALGYLGEGLTAEQTGAFLLDVIELSDRLELQRSNEKKMRSELEMVIAEMENLMGQRTH